MTTITLKYFAHLRSLAGCDQETLELPEACDVDAVHAAVTERHPALSQILHHTRLAHNHTFVRGELHLQSGDEIAFIPPVSGG